MRKERDALQKEVGPARSCLARGSEKLKKKFSRKGRKTDREKQLYSFLMYISLLNFRLRTRLKTKATKPK